MTSKKRARDNERRRREQLERKVAERQRRREQAVRIGAIVVGAVAILALAAWGIIAALTSDSTAEPSVTPTDTSDIELADGWGTSPAPPDPSYAEGRTWTVTIDTNRGPLEFELDGVAAPQATASFVALAQDGFFDGTDCHRITTAGIYVLQCGDPTGTGQGGPIYRYGPIENAPDDDVYPAGTVAMARVGSDGQSMGSQFFIVYEDSTIPSDSAGGYTVFGSVTEGLDMVEGVAQAGTIEGGPDGYPALSVILNEVSVS